MNLDQIRADQREGVILPCDDVMAGFLETQTILHEAAAVRRRNGGFRVACGHAWTDTRSEHREHACTRITWHTGEHRCSCGAASGGNRITRPGPRRSVA